MGNASADHETINVDLGDRGYDILVGDNLLESAGERVAALFPHSRAVVVTDKNVDRIHGAKLRDSMATAGLACETIAVEPGEQSKSFSVLETVVDGVLATGMERGDVVLAFGGGVVGDLAGFAAGVIRRGMRFVQIPTSLLAQVDSSVGGKTGINSPRGKNLVGLFNQPSLVIADTSVLDTLPRREMRAGYAEIAKYGLIDRPDFFGWLENNHEAVFEGGEARQYAIAESCRAKAAVVKADELEQGNRALLNLGHTFGHALEAFVKYDGTRLVHGEGVSVGMVLAHEFSCHLNQCGAGEAERVSKHLDAVGLPTAISQIPGPKPSAEFLMQAIAQDKKVQRGTLTFVLTNGVGRSFVAKDVPPQEVRNFLERKLAY